MNIIFKPVFPCQRQPVLDSENCFLRIKIEQSGINKLDHCVLTGLHSQKIIGTLVMLSSKICLHNEIAPLDSNDLDHCVVAFYRCH